MQILCFYERRPYLPKPRIICASKSACYLCNLFLEIHGQFITPRTHGKLYHRWTLPSERSLDEGVLRRLLPAIHELNRVLEPTIAKALNGQILQRALPNESVLGLREPWSSTSTSIRQHSTNLGTSSSRPNRIDNESLPGSYDLIIDTQASSIMTVSVQSAYDKQTTFLEPGDQVCKNLESVLCLHFETRSIHLQVSWSNGTSVDAASPAAVAYRHRVRVECLSEHSEVIHDIPMFDVNRLQCGRCEVIDSDDNFNSSRVALVNGIHRVLVTFEKVRGSKSASFLSQSVAGVDDIKLLSARVRLDGKHAMIL